ncbi:MAG: hypothetical protein KGI38_13110, partial [Thaumarchaeota archaeon]|nr:hypothetical protein [Nitrososphaerota archaeon]
MSEATRSSTESEDDLYAILNRLKIEYLAKEPLEVHGQTWPDGKPIVLIPDAIIASPGLCMGI